MGLVPSVVFQGQRVRVLFNTLHVRPQAETFHEFLRNVVLWTLGQEWWKHQSKLPEARMHVVVRWKYSLARLTQQRPNKVLVEDNREVFAVDAPRPIWALIMLGYDLFCLQAKNALPSFLVDRLTRNRDFQAARYEVAVAAVMTRAGFETRFLDEGAKKEKHCEFIARHRESGIEMGVEAKSRVRSGVLHEPGDFSYSQDWEGVFNLIRKAKKQKPPGLPFILFVDLNLPPSPRIAPNKKPWMTDLAGALKNLEKSLKGANWPFNAIFPTNFGLHFDLPGETGLRTEWGYYVPSRPDTPLHDKKVIKAVMDVLARYTRIPTEV